MSKQEENAIQLKLPESNVLVIRKDAVKTVQAYYGGRNCECVVNGIKTISAFDDIIKELGWEVVEI